MATKKKTTKKKTTKKKTAKSVTRRTASAGGSVGSLRSYLQERMDDVDKLQKAYLDVAERVLTDGKYEPAQWLADAINLYTMGWTTFLKGLKVPSSNGAAARSSASGTKKKTTKKSKKKAKKRA